MRVLHIISSGGMYGAEAVILNLSRALNADGHDSVLGIFRNSSDPNMQLYEAAQREGIDAHTISCRGQVDRSVPGSIRALAHRVKADVIHAHGYKADVYVFLAMRKTRTPIVSTCHTWYDNDVFVRIYGAVDRWVLKRYSAVVAVSDSVRQRLLDSGVSSNKVMLIRNGIDLAPFIPIDRKTVEGKDTNLQIGLVGRLSPEKGVDIFIRAAAKVLVDFPGAEFRIVGDGPLHAELLALIQKLELENSVFLIGRSEDMPAFYRSLDLLVSSSRDEGLPIALLEGMASGLALVATAVGAVPTLVVDNETGCLVSSEDIDEVAEGIARLLRDPALRRAYGVAGRQRIERLFSAQGMASDYLKLYARVVDAQGLV